MHGLPSLFGVQSQCTGNQTSPQKMDQEKGKIRKHQSQGKECAAAEFNSLEYNIDGTLSGVHFFKISYRELCLSTLVQFDQKKNVNMEEKIFM